MITRDRAKPIVERALIRFEEHYGKYLKESSIHFPEIRYDMKGKRGGCVIQEGGKCVIRINKWIVENNAGALEEILYHELAHVFAFFLYGNIYHKQTKKRRIHGKEWKRIMIWLGRDPLTTHSFNLESRQDSKLFLYHCNCSEYKLTIIRHNKTKKGSKYGCKKCKKILKEGGLRKD